MSGDRGVDPGALLRTSAEQLSRSDLVATRRIRGKALKITPNSSEVLQLLVMVLSGQSEHDAALRHPQRAVSLDSARRSTRSNLGKALHAVGRSDAALEASRVGKSLAATAGQVHVSLGNVLLDRKCVWPPVRTARGYCFA